MNEPTRAISIRQPWAYLIVRPDLRDSNLRLAPHVLKDVENRTWPTHFRGPVLIHASGLLDIEEWKAALPLARHLNIAMPHPKLVRYGGIIGQAEVVDCVTKYESPWFCGPYGFVLAHQKPLPFQKCRGALGFFKPLLTSETAQERLL